MEKPKRIKDYLKVRREGGSIVLTVGSVIPRDWQLVTIEERKRPADNKRLILITRID